MDTGRQLRFWVGLPPTLRVQPRLVSEFVDDLLTFLRPFGTRVVHSSEPRWYRVSKRGRGRLHVALASQRVELLTIGGGDHGDPALRTARASVMLNLGNGTFPFVAASLQGDFDTLPEERLSAVRSDAAALVRRWFDPLQAASAWVSDQPSDTPHRTAHEAAYQLFGLGHWSALQRYFRGAFWGNALGPGLCRRLGSVDRVLAEAPVALAERLGDGAWLQLGPTAPSSTDELSRLADFLSPVLFWTPGDLELLRPAEPEGAVRRPPRLDIARPSESVHIHLPVHVIEYDVTIYPGHPGPPTLLEEAVLERDLSFNIHLERRPTREEQVALLALIEAWAADIEGQSPGGLAFRHRYAPALDVAGRTLRMHVEAGELGSFETARRLIRWLAAVPELRVRDVVVGTEVTG